MPVHITRRQAEGGQLTTHYSLFIVYYIFPSLLSTRYPLLTTVPLSPCPTSKVHGLRAKILDACFRRHDTVVLVFPLFCFPLSFLRNLSPLPRNQDYQGTRIPTHHSLFTIYCLLSSPHYPLFSLSVIPAKAGNHNPIYPLLATHYCLLSPSLQSKVYGLKSKITLATRYYLLATIYPVSSLTLFKRAW